MFYSVDNENFCIREKIGDHWFIVYKTDNNWIDILPETDIDSFRYKLIVDDQDKIKQILIGLI
jgi:hypothetical protein